MAGQTLRKNNRLAAIPYASGERRWKGLSILLMACVMSMFNSGCPTAMQYQPNEKMVDELGLPQARQRLKEVLLRAVNPKIDEVEITDQFLRYHLTGTTYEVRLFFKDMHRVDVYGNHVVLIRDRQDGMLARPLFANTEDAQMFANLMASFRAHYAPSSSGAR
jgi:hypothetical protein